MEYPYAPKMRTQIFLIFLVIVLAPLMHAADLFGEGIYGDGAYGQAICGDNVCDNSESCSICETDCGICSSNNTNNGGGGGGSGSPTSTKTSIIVGVNAGIATKISNFAGTGIKEIEVTVKNSVAEIKIQVSKYDSKPTNVTKNFPRKTYRYIHIETENLNENLEEATVRFEVNKSWALDNNLGKEDIAIFKFDETDEEWNELETTYESEENDEYIYSIRLNSFSYFAIGEKAKIPIISDIADSVAESYTQASQTKFGLILWWTIFSVLFLGVITVIILLVQSIKNNFEEMPVTELRKANTLGR